MVVQCLECMLRCRLAVPLDCMRVCPFPLSACELCGSASTNLNFTQRVSPLASTLLLRWLQVPPPARWLKWKPPCSRPGQPPTRPAGAARAMRAPAGELR